MNRDTLRDALQRENVRAFLRVIRAGESGQDDDAYRIQFGGSHFDAPPWNHPHKVVVVGRMKSSAAGAYQFLTSTWDALEAAYQFEDFSPACQDEAAVALIKGRKALDDVLAGNFESAIDKCAKEWASLPGSPYGQPTMTMDEARDIYQRYGGTYAEAAAPPTQEAPMVPLLPVFSALLPTIVDLIPALASIFKPGSEVAARNVAGATVVARALQEATNSPNLQAAVEAMQANPEARAAATAAVTAPEVWNQIAEVGGGIVEARKVAADPNTVPPWRNTAFWFWMSVLPVIWAATVAVLFGKVWGIEFSDDIKMMTLTAIFTGLAGAGSGFFLGSSLSSQRKDATLTRK